jgi:trimeric autotransporter adhesin
MSKNTTRKGLAFGAGVALVASGFVGTPANAIELNEYITLAPTSGPASAYAVFAAAGADFSVTATPNASAMVGSGNLSFHVADTDSNFLPNELSSNGKQVTAAEDAVALVNVTTDMVSMVIPSGVADGAYVWFAETDLSADGEATAVIATAKKLKTGYVVNDQLIFSSDADITSANDNAGTKAVLANTVITLVPTAASSVVLDTDAIAQGTGEVSITGQAITVTTSGVADGTYAVFSTTDFVTEAEGGAGTDTADVSLAAKSAIFVTVSSDSFTFTSASTLVDADATVAAETLTFVAAPASSGRAVDGSFVTDTGVGSSGATGAVSVETTDGETRTAVVTAFVDDFANGVYAPASEFGSAAASVVFTHRDDVTWSTTIDAPQVGDATISAEATSDPMINGAENDDASNVAIAFTRQDSSSLKLSGDATQSATTGIWSASVATDLASNVRELVAADGTVSGTDAWDDLVTPISGDGTPRSIDEVDSSIADEVVTIEVDAAHGLRVGDLITIAAMTDGVETVAPAAALLNAEHEITSIPTTTSFTFTVADIVDDAALGAGDSTYIVSTYDSPANSGLVDRVFAGDYTAQVAIEDANGGNWFRAGTASAAATQAALAADMVFVSTASANVEGTEVKNSVDTNTDADIRAGVLTASVVATVVDVDGDAVGANRPVTYTLTRSSTTIKVNASTLGKTVYTDANGQVTFDVTDTVGTDGKKVTIAATPEGVSSAAVSFTFEWNAAAFTLVDMNDTKSEIGGSTGDQTEKRSILAGASYTVAALVADQWYVPADSDTYRIQVTGDGATIGNRTLVAGKTDIVVSDAGISTSYNTVLTLQKKSAAGVWGKVVAKTMQNLVVSGPSVKLAANGSNVYESTAADLSDAVAAKALVERDSRTAFVAKPVYTNAVTVTGKTASATTGVSQAGTVVTISGPSNILFEHGSIDVAKRGSLTFVSDGTDGEFTVDLYSTTAQTDTVITVTANGVSNTVKVSFTGIGVGEGTSLVVTTPAAVKPASTFQVKAKLADVYGNGVDTAAGRVKVTYTGAGIVFGTLPTETDANGELQFSVLLGSNDTGTVSVTVSYDQNGDADYVDAKDLSTTATTEITASGVASSEQKVNAGSFKGYVALYAKGYKGKKMSAIVAGKWLVVESLASDFERVVRYTGAGYDIVTTIYIDGVKMETFNLTTK